MEKYTKQSRNFTSAKIKNPCLSGFLISLGIFAVLYAVAIYCEKYVCFIGIPAQTAYHAEFTIDSSQVKSVADFTVYIDDSELMLPFETGGCLLFNRDMSEGAHKIRIKSEDMFTNTVEFEVTENTRSFRVYLTESNSGLELVSDF